LTHDHLIKFFIFLKKIKKEKRKKKREKKLWVAEATPKPPLGVVSATPFGPWGGSLVPKGVAVATPSFFFSLFYF
jgi:hypothetical protein